MKIIEFYTAVLKDLRISDLDGEGLLSTTLNGNNYPVTLEGGKRLCLPTQEILRQGVFDHLFPFHPLCENVTLGASVMIEALREYAEFRINTDILAILADLAVVAANTAGQKKLGSKASQFLRKVNDVDEKFVEVVEKLADARAKDPKKKIVNIFLLRGGKEGSPASRTAVVSFPILDEIEKWKDGKLFGVVVRKKDVPMLKALIEYVLFGTDAPDQELYTFGSRSNEAPYLHALLTSFYKLAARFNQVIDIHAKHLEDADNLRYNLDWLPALDNFHLYRGVIPPLEGNIGEHMQGTRAAAEDRPVPAAFNRPAEPAREALNLPWETTPAQQTAAPSNDVAAMMAKLTGGGQQQEQPQHGFSLQAFRNHNSEYRDPFSTLNPRDRGHLNNRIPGGIPGADFI